MTRSRARHGAAALAALAALSALAPLGLLAAAGACALDVEGSVGAASAEGGVDGDVPDTTPGPADEDGASDASLGDASLGDAQASDALSDGDAPRDGDVADTPVVVPGPFVYAHNSTDLYKIDVGLRKYTSVPLQGCGALQDIAVTSAGLVDGNTTASLFRISVTGVCTKQYDAAFPFTLAYAPAGTLQAQEALVAVEARDYVRYDGVGTKTIVKNNALAAGVSPSGDVACKGTSCFVSVVSATCADCLHEIDATSGTFLKDWGPIGSAKVVGLAFGGSKLYGFTEAGAVLEIQFLAVTLLTTPLVGMPVVQFIGAGSAP